MVTGRVFGLNYQLHAAQYFLRS